MFILAMITIMSGGTPMIERIGTFEHYGYCLQAEAAMSESVSHMPDRYHQLYRCFPIKVEDAEKETHS